MNDLQSSLQIATAHLYTGKETGTKSSPNIPRKDQRHGQSGLSEEPRQLYPELRETVCSPSPFTGNQQTHLQSSTSTRPSSSFSTAYLLSAAELLGKASILDEAGQKTSTLKCQYKSDLTAGRVERPPAKKGRRLRRAKVHNREVMAAKREIFLLRNRQAARKCREKKKALVADLLKSAEFFSINNAKIPYVIEQIILELNDLSAMAVSTTEFAPTVARNSSPGLTKGY